jgi:transposase
MLRRQLMAGNKLHGDDTSVPAPGNGKTRMGRLWIVCAAPQRHGSCYAPDRKGEHRKPHLSQFTGTLQADGYAEFDQNLP